MAQQVINIGTVAGDGTGDSLRESQRKSNENFSEIYTRYAPNLGVVTPTDTPTGTGINYWECIEAGTYTNFGGVVLGANSRGTIFRNLSGVFSISQVAYDVSGKVNVSDVINTLVSSETAKPLSAAQGKALQDGKVNISDVINTLVSTETAKPLSANQGKVLNEKTDLINNFGNRNTYTNLEVANKFIKEIYLFGDWGGDVYIGEYRKKSIYGSNVLFKNSGGTIIFNASFTDGELNSNVIYKEDGTKKFYAILNWDSVTDGDIIYGFNALVNYQAYALNYSPIIKRSLATVETPIFSTVPDTNIIYKTDVAGTYVNFDATVNFPLVVNFGESAELIFDFKTNFWKKITLSKKEVFPFKKNLFNPNAVILGQYVSGSTTAASALWCTSEPIPVVNGMLYTVKGAYKMGGIAQILDINKNVISDDTTYTDGVAANYNFVVYNVNAKFVKFVVSEGFNDFSTISFFAESNKDSAFESFEPIFYDNKDAVYNFKNLLRANKAVLIGDSITELANSWTKNFKSEIACAFNNLAKVSASVTDLVSGTVYDGVDFTGNLNVLGNQVKKAIDANYTDTPFILIFAGSNNSVNYITTDAQIETIFSTAIDSVDRTEIVGALRWCFIKLTDKYPNARIIFVTPYQSASGSRTYLLQKNTVKNIINASNRLGATVLNLYDTSGIHSAYEVQDASGKYLYDGVHLNLAGAKLISDYFIKNISKILF